MASSEKQLKELQRRVIQAQSYDDGDTSLCATCAIALLGWINTSRHYGSGFIDTNGVIRTWRDLPSLEKCAELVSSALDAAAAVDGNAQWNAAIEAAEREARRLSEKYATLGANSENDEQRDRQFARVNALRESAAAIRSLKRG